MAASVTLPVFIRVGDGEEVQIGAITADSATEIQAEQADLLRAVASEIESLLDDRSGQEGLRP